MPFPLLLLLGAALAGAAIVAICWDDICGWFHENKQNYDDYGEMIRERLADGNVRVVSGVFNSRGELTASNQWVGEEDQEIRSVFGHDDHIRVSI